MPAPPAPDTAPSIMPKAKADSFQLPAPGDQPKNLFVWQENMQVGDVVADRSTLSWVNMLLEWIWPKANTALSNWVHEDLTARLQESLPGPFKGAHFSRFTLGKQTPEFGPIEVIRHSEDHVEVDLEMRYFSDVDICLDAGVISLGINQLTFVGRLCMVLQPLIGKWPMIGCTKLFFASVPQVTLRFTGLASVANYVGVEDIVQRTVDDWMRVRMVLPNRGIWLNSHFEEDSDMFDAKSLQPLGVLRVRAVRARNLAGVNVQVLDADRFTSDPYCMLRLGSEQSRSSTIIGTTDPEWPETEPSAFFTVYHRDQCLEADVLGEDQGGMFGSANLVSLLGQLPPGISVWQIMTQWPHVASGDGRRCQRITLDTKRVKRDVLHVNDPVNLGISSELDMEAQWYDIVDSPVPQPLPNGPSRGAPAATFQVEIFKGFGFPVEQVERGGRGIRWRVNVCGPSEMDDLGGSGKSTSSTSRKGTVCDVQELQFPDLPIHPRLFQVIDKLLQKPGFSSADVARICGIDGGDTVDLYVHMRDEHHQLHQELQKARQQGQHRVNVQWYEALHCFVRHPEDGNVTFSLELLNGEDRVIGVVGPFVVKKFVDEQADVKELATHRLDLKVLTEGGNDGGGLLGGWFRSSSRQVPDLHRWEAVEVQVSARLRYLKAGGTQGTAMPRSPVKGSPAKGSGSPAKGSPSTTSPHHDVPQWGLPRSLSETHAV